MRPSNWLLSLILSDPSPHFLPLSAASFDQMHFDVLFQNAMMSPKGLNRSQLPFINPLFDGRKADAKDFLRPHEVDAV